MVPRRMAAGDRTSQPTGAAPSSGYAAPPIMGRPRTLSDATFRDTVAGSALPVLVDFWAQWNSTCKALAPSIDVLAEEYEGRAIVAKLEVDANPVTPAMFGITSVPQLLFFVDGQVASRIVGYLPIDALRAELHALLEPAGR